MNRGQLQRNTPQRGSGPQKSNASEEYSIVLRDENCDNLIRQTIEFLEVVKGLKVESRLKIKVSLEDVREPCCVYRGQVVWGYSEIVKLLMQAGQNRPTHSSVKQQQFGSKSPYEADDVMNETFTQLNPANDQLNKFHDQILSQGDHDEADQIGGESPNKRGKKQISFENKTNGRQQPEQKQTKRAPEPVVVDQVALDNEYHSRFLDELKSGGD